jgi:hypothetical protein
MTVASQRGRVPGTVLLSLSNITPKKRAGGWGRLRRLLGPRTGTSAHNEHDRLPPPPRYSTAVVPRSPCACHPRPQPDRMASFAQSLHGANERWEPPFSQPFFDVTVVNEMKPTPKEEPVHSSTSATTVLLAQSTVRNPQQSQPTSPALCWAL